MCPICLNDTDPNTDATLDCGGNHVLHLACLQQLAAQFGGAFATNDQGPHGSLINYIDLPTCPMCRGRFSLAPHVADPNGLDGYLNNNPVAPPHRFYYDGAQGLTAAEVQTYVIDAAQQALDDVNDLSSDESSDESDDEEMDENVDEEMDANEDEDDEPKSLGFHFCPQCGEQAEFIVYPSGQVYRDEHPDDDFTPCPECDNDVDENDENVVACMACWAVWHEGCR